MQKKRQEPEFGVGPDGRLQRIFYDSNKYKKKCDNPHRGSHIIQKEDSDELRYFEWLLKEDEELDLTYWEKGKHGSQTYRMVPDFELTGMGTKVEIKFGKQYRKIYGYCPLHDRTHQSNNWWVSQFVDEGPDPPKGPWIIGCFDSEGTKFMGNKLICHTNLCFLFNDFQIN